jgi:hypothetical protein
MSNTALDISALSRDNKERGSEDLERPKTMRNVSGRIHHILQLASMLLRLSADAWRFLVLCLQPTPALAAEILFLRKQLALYKERQVKPRGATNAPRIAMVWLSHWFEWRSALRLVKPETFTRWHRQGFRLLWRWKSKPGRPRIPAALQALIRQMARDNPTWGQERIANALWLKLGLQVSPRTVRTYIPSHCVGGQGKCHQSQRWSTFICNHAKGIVACDFCVVITATFRILYVFVIIEHASRWLLHVNVTAHPTAQWAMQQFREAIPADHTYRILIHDRDAIFSKDVDSRTSPGVARAQNASTNARGQCDLRTSHRDAAARVSGLCDPAEREASSRHHEGMGDTLQLGPPSHVTRAGYSATTACVAGVTTSKSASDSHGSTCGSAICLGRPAP